MKQLFALLFLCGTVFFSCSSAHNITNIEPKTGTITIPAKGELRIWRNLKHASFEVKLDNASTNQSVELFRVKSDGNERWVSPSLLAKSSLTVTIPTDGHLLIKNFNLNDFTINYKIIE